MSIRITGRLGGKHVAAETARSFAQACSFADQAQVARETTRLQDQTVALTKRLFDAGRNSRLEYAQAVALQQDYADAHFNQALALLTLGDYAKGFAQYEWRWKRTGITRRSVGKP